MESEKKHLSIIKTVSVLAYSLLSGFIIFRILYIMAGDGMFGHFFLFYWVSSMFVLPVVFMSLIVWLAGSQGRRKAVIVLISGLIFVVEVIALFWTPDSRQPYFLEVLILQAAYLISLVSAFYLRRIIAKIVIAFLGLVTFAMFGVIVYAFVAYDLISLLYGEYFTMLMGVVISKSYVWLGLTMTFVLVFMPYVSLFMNTKKLEEIDRQELSCLNETDEV